MTGCLSHQRHAFLETIAQVQNDLGLVYYGQRRFELDAKTFHNSISTYSQIPGGFKNSSTDTLMCIIFNHGNACRMMQDLKTAEAAFTRIYEFFDRKRRNHNVQLPPWAEIIVSRILNALGELCLERNEAEIAMAKFKDALSTQENYLVNSHPIILSTKLNLGRAYTALESYSEAREILQDLMQKYAEQWGADHEAVATVADELARASMGYGQMMRESLSSDNTGLEAFKEAERLWLDNLSFYGERYGAESEDALRTKSNIALLQSVTGEVSMARRNMLQVFQRSTTRRRRSKHNAT